MLSSPDTLSATNQIYLSGLEHDLIINGFKAYQILMIVKVLATQMKFL